MHVTNPREIQKRAAKKRRSNILPLIFGGVVVIGLAAGGLYWFVLRPVPMNTQGEPVTSSAAATQIATQAPKNKTTLKTFTGTEFRDLYRSVNYPNTQNFSTPPEITGNPTADARIRAMAEKRGFLLTSVPLSPIVKTGEELIAGNGDDLLQPLAQKSWKELKTAARKDNIQLSLISAYRSPKWQRELFMERLLAQNVTVQQIADGRGETALNTTLSMTAVPGYSRHHTGYTIDLYCDDGIAFGDSSCNKWITKNNYENAKKYGWIPSYPPGAGEQGPEPEPWEFVWVGTDALYQ
jgi:LAS superfamily LD-carboxypeptidase LdcB